MPGMQFEYDEEGGTFFYFLLSFWGLVIIPATYYLWPRQQSKDEKERLRRQCQCPLCCVKRQRLSVNTSWLKTREKAVKIGLLLGWVVFILLAYKVSKIQMDYVEYDPFNELGIDRGATQREIKKAYRALSLQHHPDKGGDEKKFMKISKAYAALTDEESKKNWEEYGNPDGPGVTRFGIALPKWIIEDENSKWILLVYIVIFMVIMPVVVGVWWYRSIKFSKDQVLLDTTRLFFYFFQKQPNMILKKVIMVLAASFEFEKSHNSEIVERPSDNEEVPQLMKKLPNLDEKNKEKPLCFVYSVKARALLHAHYARQELPPNSLDVDRCYILRKCPSLVNEMVNVISQLVASCMARQTMSQMPRLDTVENVMKTSQMIIQGVEAKSSPLLQLPHIRQDMLRHFVTKKRNVQRIRDLVRMEEDDRRALLRQLNDSEYKDVMNVCAVMPNIEMIIKSEVLDDDDSSITAGSIVTVTVTLKRTNLIDNYDSSPFEDEVQAEPEEEGEEKREEEEEEEVEEVKPQENTVALPEHKHKAWQKQAKGKKKGGKAKAKKPKQPYQWKKVVQTVGTKTEPESNEGATADKDQEEEANSDSEEEMEDQSEAPQEKQVIEKKASKPRKRKESEDDGDDWEKYQEEFKKENSLDTKKKESWSVHCPHYPEVKQEGWWIFVGDKKHHMLISAPVHIQSLKEEEETQLKFSAPHKIGVYTYSVILKSDSYIDFDQSQNIKLDVKEAKVVEDHPQWDISDDEEDKDAQDDDVSEDSDYSTDADEFE